MSPATGVYWRPGSVECLNVWVRRLYLPPAAGAVMSMWNSA